MEYLTLPGGSLALALALGFLPPLFWLWFWLKEDRHPEPRIYIFRTFVFGMLAAGVAGLLEVGTLKFGLGLIASLIVWSAIEEIVKYASAYFGALTTKVFDEPVDALIYLITAALGFAAAENVLFLIKATWSNGVLSSLLTGNLRFLGALLLHVATSAVVGAVIASSFFSRKNAKRNVFVGLLLSTGLHFVFNFSILKGDGTNVFSVFLPLWGFVILVFLLFEKIKSLKA